MKFSVLSVLGFSIVVNCFAQKNQDKGAFIEYENKFYKEIKEGINEFDEGELEVEKSFKMDYSSRTLPKSVDEFTTVWCNDPISQGNTGTCWCFSTSSFYEAEIQRLTKKQVKLSELYIVYWEYVEKSREYIRTRGTSSFGEGSETNAVARMMAQYGAMPASEFDGLLKGQKFHNHAVMFDEMYGYLKSLKTNNAWNEEMALTTIKAILNHYMGTPPENFQFEGKTYTPRSFLADVTKLVPEDYATFMSLKQHPYFTKAVYDVPDNWWRSDDYNNLPLNDFMELIKSAVKGGYSLAIGGDVSESGYSPIQDVAMIPSYDIPSEYINEDARQLRFTNGSTTDDHAIHLVGYKETKDDFWFLIKDSGSGARNGKNSGFYFYHQDYVKLKTMSFTVHKDAAKKWLDKVK